MKIATKEPEYKILPKRKCSDKNKFKENLYLYNSSYKTKKNIVEEKEV